MIGNVIALLFGALFVMVLGLALLWRLGAWKVTQAEALNEDEGLRIGSRAPEIACYSREQEMHLTFVGRTSFVVLGLHDCEPCRALLDIAPRHPATAHLRRVYLSDIDELDTEVEPETRAGWEIYRLHAEQHVRRQWRAPVSPYFHVIDEHGRVVAKGIANKPEHLDRLFAVRPPAVASAPEPVHNA